MGGDGENRVGEHNKRNGINVRVKKCTQNSSKSTMFRRRRRKEICEEWEWYKKKNTNKINETEQICISSIVVE